MASFSETATLRVIDESSKQINEINRALAALGKTAAAFGSKKINLGVDTSKMSAAGQVLHKLTTEANALKNTRVNLSVNSSGIASAERQLRSLRAQASHPITQRIKHLAVGIAAGAGISNVVHGLGHAAVEGVKQSDVGAASLDLKMLSKAHRDFVEKQISEIGTQQAARPGGAMFNRGQIEKQYSEMLGTVNIGSAKTEEEFKALATQAKTMSDQNLELAGTLIKLGKSSDEAYEDSVKFGKAIDLQGQIYDKATGKMDPEKAKAAYDQVRALIPSVGAEMTGGNYLQMMKYLRTSKFALAPESMAIAMRNFEEMGTGAAVGLNQFIKNLSGQAKPAQLKEQKRLGLATGTEAFQQRLREHPLQTVEQDIVPALIKDLMKGGKGRKPLTREAGRRQDLRPGLCRRPDGQDVLRPHRAGDGHLADAAAHRVRQVPRRPGIAPRRIHSRRPARCPAILHDRCRRAISSQMQGLMGELVRSAAPVLVPTMNVASEAMREFANTTAEASSGQCRGPGETEDRRGGRPRCQPRSPRWVLTSPKA